MIDPRFVLTLAAGLLLLLSGLNAGRERPTGAAPSPADGEGAERIPPEVPRS